MLRGSTGPPFWKLKIEGVGIARPQRDGPRSAILVPRRVARMMEVFPNDATILINAALRLADGLQPELRHQVSVSE
ncbi:hypothetical protein BOSEA31B_13545 [Hyphomicrobiales bacterium]|nr:hypothetical protein BOSEA31B_13545 [Hyphomicrobiales bacterium]CAH1699316.1 hypothetical protein BOSEA1005_12369 [Hyphomicrobiales bacterium]CAI0343103.1 hypothetical protein BO1005MUT1_210168 [Hyphomicrobiales bacterium]